MSLNPSQKSYLAATLRTADTQVCALETLVGEPSQGALLHIQRRLPDEQRQRLRDLAAAIRAEIAAESRPREAAEHRWRAHFITG
jgi:hypothetical protein